MLGSVKEGRFLLPGRDARPADLLIPRWSGGQDAALDVTVVSALQTAMRGKLQNLVRHAGLKASALSHWQQTHWEACMVWLSSRLRNWELLLPGTKARRSKRLFATSFSG